MNNGSPTTGAVPEVDHAPTPLAANERHPFLFILIIGAVLAAVAVRWYGLATQSFWHDEGYTLRISQLSLPEIWTRVRADTSPPLYYWLLHFWIRIFGISELSLRGMSAFFATISIPVFVMVAKRVVREEAAVWAIWLYAVCGIQAHYAHEARFYAVLVFCSITSFYCLLVFLAERSLLSFAGLVLTLAAGLYIHNMMFFYLPGFALAWLVYPAEQNLARRVKDGLLCGAVLLLVYLPWIPSLLAQTRRVASSFWVPRPGAWDLVVTLSSLSGLDFYSLFPMFHRMLHWPLYHPWVFILALLFPLAGCIFTAFWKTGPIERRKAAALLSYAVIPVLLAFVYSLGSSSVFLLRAFIASAAVLSILFACSVSRQEGTPKMLATLLAALVLAAGAASLIGFFRFYKNEDWRGATKYLVGLPPERRFIVFGNSNGKALFDYYSGKGKQTNGGETVNKTRFEPLVWSTDDYSHVTMLRDLQEALQSGGYDEIDVVPSYAAPSVGEHLQKLVEGKCSSLEKTEFTGVQIFRCIPAQIHPPKAPSMTALAKD